MSEKQIAALAKASKKKQQESLDKTELAIEYLIENNFKITVRSVAKQAGVSISYIYKYPALVNRIKKLTKEQNNLIYRDNLLLDTTSNKIDKLKAKNKELTQEIDRLKTYIQSIEGKNNPLERLQIENQQLKQELEYTQKALEETRNFILSQGYDTQDEIRSETTERIMRVIASEET